MNSKEGFFVTIKINLCCRINIWECHCRFHISFLFFSLYQTCVAWHWCGLASWRCHLFVQQIDTVIVISNYAQCVHSNSYKALQVGMFPYMYCFKFCQYQSTHRMMCVYMKIGFIQPQYGELFLFPTVAKSFEYAACHWYCFKFEEIENNPLRTVKIIYFIFLLPLFFLSHSLWLFSTYPFRHVR